MIYNPIVYALDTSCPDKALELASSLHGHIMLLKVGMEFYMSMDVMDRHPNYEEIFGTYMNEIFLDMKFHDIPNTVHHAVKSSIKNIAPRFITVHGHGGKDMMKAALDAKDGLTEILAVTQLTSKQSLPKKDLYNMVEDALKVGIDGIVCSPLESHELRHEFGDDFTIVTPGIRPKGFSKDDQKRTATPKDALKRGSTLLVIGRPITESPDPVQTTIDILKDVGYK